MHIALKRTPLLVHARKNRRVISPLTSYGLSGYFRSALFSKSSTGGGWSNPTGAPSAFLIDREILAECGFLFFARYRGERARDNEDFVSGSFLNLQRGGYSSRGRVSVITFECSYECNYSYKQTYMRAIKKKLVMVVGRMSQDRDPPFRSRAETLIARERGGEEIDSFLARLIRRKRKGVFSPS